MYPCSVVLDPDITRSSAVAIIDLEVLNLLYGERGHGSWQQRLGGMGGKIVGPRRKWACESRAR